MASRFQRLTANVLAVVDSTCVILTKTGLAGRFESKLSKKVVSHKPASPYFGYRLLKDPPGRYKTQYGDLLLMPIAPKPVMVKYAIEEHVTPINQRKEMTLEEVKRLKAGDPGVRVHWDLRWTDPETGEVHAVVLPKARLPVMVLGKKGTLVPERMGVQKVDDRHGHTELVNTGIPHRGKVVIAEGYGRGHSRIIQQGETFIWTGKEDNFHIWIPGKGPFAIIQPDYAKQGEPRNYLMFPLARKETEHIGRPYKVIGLNDKPERLHQIINDPEWIAERKYDGAFYTIVVNRRPGHDYANVQVISRRPAHVDGQPTSAGIDRSYNLPHVKFADWPEWAYGKKIFVEVYSKTKGKHKSEHGRSTALLNMDPAQSMLEQQANGKLRIKVLGIEGYDYEDQRKIAADLNREVVYVDHRGKTIHPLRIPSSASTSKGKEHLIQKLQGRTGEEGVVFKNLHGPPVLAKYVFKGQTEDLRVVGVERIKSSQPKYLNSEGEVVAAQRFLVEDESGHRRHVVIRDPEGGPGSTDAMRLDAGLHPEKYLGAYVEVKARRGNRAQTGDIVRIRWDK